MPCVDARGGCSLGWVEWKKRRRRSARARRLNRKTVVVTPGAEQAQTRSSFWRHRQVQAEVHPRLAAPLSPSHSLTHSFPFSPSSASFSASSSRALAYNRADFEIEITRSGTHSAHRESGWFRWKFLTYVTRPRSLSRERTLINGFLCGSLSWLRINWQGDCRDETKDTRSIRVS